MARPCYKKATVTEYGNGGTDSYRGRSHRTFTRGFGQRCAPRQAPVEPNRWDGRTLGYIPSGPLRLAGKVALHDEVAGQIDPITFEVIRNALWIVNEEHADTIRKVAASPVASLLQRSQHRDSDRTRRAGHVRALRAVLRRRVRPGGPMDAGEPRRESGHLRRRRVLPERSADRRQPSDGRADLRPGVRRRRVVLLGVQLGPRTRHRRHRAGQLLRRGHATFTARPRRFRRSSWSSAGGCAPTSSR